MKKRKLDKTDRRLLDLLQDDSRQSLEQLAEQVHLSAPAAQRRIKRMRDEAVIIGDVSVVDSVAVGLPMTFVILVELERERAEQVDQFRRKAEDEQLVQQCYYVTGEADFIIIALAQNMDDFEALTRRLFFEDKNVRRFRTSVVMGKGFRSLTVPATHPLLT